MKTVAMRYSERFAPKYGTILAHQYMIEESGFVWYGKMGRPLSSKTISELEKQDDLRILLIKSGKSDRYWAYVSEITKEIPSLNEIPEYYRNEADRFKTWFKITRIEPAPRDVMSKCIVVSSGLALNVVSQGNMNPFFIIEYDGKY